MEFHAAKRLYLLYLLVSLLITAVGFYATSTQVHWIWTSLLIIVGTSLSLLFAKQLLTRVPRLILDNEGVTDVTLQVGKIRWQDIDRMQLVHRHQSAFITLDMSDLANHYYTQHFSPIKRKVLASNTATGLSLLNLNLTALQTSPDQVYDAVQHFHQQSKQAD